jgi:hypothetical protein
MGRWNFSCSHSLSLYNKEWSASSPGRFIFRESASTPVDYKAGWNPEPGWMLPTKRYSSLPLMGIEPRFLGRQDISVVAVPTVLSRSPSVQVTLTRMTTVVQAWPENVLPARCRPANQLNYMTWSSQQFATVLLFPESRIQGIVPGSSITLYSLMW